MSKDSTAGKADDWQPQKRQEDGVHLTGSEDLPANHRLRAERLVSLRRRSDPDGIVSDELIADTAARLKLERQAASEEIKAPGAEPASGGE